MILDKNKKIVVCGAGGFIGGNFTTNLFKQGYTNIIAIDVKPINMWYQKLDDLKNYQLDLKVLSSCEKSLEGADWVYNFAADMGGMGFIENHKALCMLSDLIRTHILLAAKNLRISRYFFSSSACVYAHDKQTHPLISALAEKDAYPAMPEDGYGWEKLFSERMCKHFSDDFGLITRVARFHNVYGPFGTFDGGREKAPAAIIRKVIEAKLSGTNEIEIWGDGEQTRSFMYIDDCLKGTQMIMESDRINFPINLGSSEKVSINKLTDIVEDIAGVKLKRKYNLDAPQGVQGRNSDNTLIKEFIGWEPSISLRLGMERTYKWIYDEIIAGKSKSSAVNF